ncbi:hypothetical protein ACGFIF_07890 [Kribbella sp. NPDC049174]|uniref:hypothetical protein n=1 Tax=Kribbella sp. NPDC049174 TaxID=3364112 RepID=UPI00371EC02C
MGRAVRVWSLLYGVLAAYWLAGGRAGFPVADVNGHPPGGAPVAITIALVLLLGAVAAAASVGPTSSWAQVGLRFATATALLGTFGLALTAVGIVASGTVERPLALVSQLLALVGAGALFAAALAQARRSRSRCPRCGGPHPLPPKPEQPLVRRTPRAASRRSRRTVYLVLLGVVPWATVKFVWGLGGSALGVSAAEWHATFDQTTTSGLSRILERAGLDITVLASLVGAVLAITLLSRRRLPRWLLLTPAVTGATSLALYGVPLTIWGTAVLAGLAQPAGDPAPFSPTGQAWMITFGGLAFTDLGTALAIGVHSYHRRSKPSCALPR